MLVVTPLDWLRYPMLGMRLDSRPHSAHTRLLVDNAGINLTLDTEKSLQGLPKKKKNESCLSAWTRVEGNFVENSEIQILLRVQSKSQRGAGVGGALSKIFRRGSGIIV